MLLLFGVVFFLAGVGRVVLLFLSLSGIVVMSSAGPPPALVGRDCRRYRCSDGGDGRVAALSVPLPLAVAVVTVVSWCCCCCWRWWLLLLGVSVVLLVLLLSPVDLCVVLLWWACRHIGMLVIAV